MIIKKAQSGEFEKETTAEEANRCNHNCERTKWCLPADTWLDTWYAPPFPKDSAVEVPPTKMTPQTRVFPKASLIAVPPQLRHRVFNGGAELARPVLNSCFSAVSNSKNVFLRINLAGCSSHKNIQAPQHDCPGIDSGGTTRRSSGFFCDCAEGWPVTQCCLRSTTVGSR